MLAELLLFPIPPSATVKITPVLGEVFNVELGGLSADDLRGLVGFFNAMQGATGAFRFEHGGLSYPMCRFDNDTGPVMTTGPGPHSRIIAIRILHP